MSTAKGKVKFHQVDSRCVEDTRGFFTPRCECGWRWAPVPDIETLIDALMQHARKQGLLEDGILARSGGTAP